MLDSIKAFFDKNIAPAPAADETATPEPRHDPVAVAACALLLELAHADDEFTDDERMHIEDAVVRHFDVSPDMARELMALANEERGRSVDLYQFTSLINANYDEGQRMVLAEVMWRVVHADGQLVKHESYLIRKLSNLLGLRPGYLAEARKRAEKRID